MISHNIRKDFLLNFREIRICIKKKWNQYDKNLKILNFLCNVILLLLIIIKNNNKTLILCDIYSIQGYIYYPI